MLLLKASSDSVEARLGLTSYMYCTVRYCYRYIVHFAYYAYLNRNDICVLSGPNSKGWISVQLRVLHELVYSARRMGNADIAIRLTLTVYYIMRSLQWQPLTIYGIVNYC